ncbi:TPA: hypothetical protein NKQ26_000298 [Vibrio parahaemolyticus]|uniref:hypothetical protein n=1 Tax=Vibrio parahaemolyticus TaxID=670 RepID=UPI0011212BBA|nr:hypothetical protein [Vibrio parahaemolyticus]EJG0580216.1 hypothetical protein [Vibrio parahaemolyticus]QLE38679.1 hypothetical protein FDV79_23690 [Vibrio parahaemolyticus]TOR03060.1 hypothetical protein CGG84_00040 [Vibrio parahaemolyticus]HAS6604916.1 hypothetical protein [Vibrio parahaemolyticus]HAS6609895.1 hypothetical protein [Vibrio parahaemolyticus]
MEIKQLYRLAKWYESNVVSLNIANELAHWKQNISRVLTSNNQDYGRKHQQIVATSSRYKKVLSQVDYESLSFEDIEVLGRMGLKHLILSPAVKTLDEMLEIGDLEEISARVSNAYQTLVSANELFTDFLHSLVGIFGPVVDLEESDNHGKVLTRVRFHNDASISNVVNLSEWTTKWNTIARGYSMVLGQAPEEFEVVSASKGSIIFDLLVNLETVNMIGETFNHIADFVLTCAELGVFLKGAKALSGNPELQQQVEQHVERELEAKKEQMAEEIADKLLEKFAKGESDGEIKNNLKKSIREVDNFVSKGGDIEFRTESEDLNKTEQVQLVNDALKQLQFRSNQKQLEDKTLEQE